MNYFARRQRERLERRLARQVERLRKREQEGRTNSILYRGLEAGATLTRASLRRLHRTQQ